MRNKRKKKLNPRLIHHCSGEGGFALPIVLGMGLVMILIAATMIVRAQGDQTTALAQKATNQGLSAAETGITRYQALINNNRAIAAYKDCEGTRNASGTCPDTGTTKSWSNASAIPGITSCSGNGTASVVPQAKEATWRDVSTEDLNGNGTLDTGEDINGNGVLDKDPKLGQYRLVSYVYSGTVGTAPGTGQLTVEGRVNQVGSGSGATQGISTATTRLQVNIPVQQGDTKDTPVPGAWFKQGGMEDVQTGNANKTVKGNVLLNDCSLNPTDVDYQAKTGNPPVPYTDPITGQAYKTTRSKINFPDLPTKPTIPTSNQLRTIAINGNAAMTLPNLTAIPPHTQTTVDGITAYRYSITAITQGNIVITPGAKVIFYLDGNIDKGVDIQHNCTGVSSCKPTDFQVYGYANNGQMCLNGNNAFQGFIFAPNYSVGVTGNGNIEGSVWARDFGKISNCGSNNPTIVITQNTNWNTLLGLGLNFNLPPKLSPLSLWQKQETP